MQSSSGFPSPVMSTNIGDSLSVEARIVRRCHGSSLPFGFSNQNVSAPGKPMTT